jgi:hypothetical protein
MSTPSTNRGARRTAFAAMLAGAAAAAGALAQPEAPRVPPNLAVPSDQVLIRVAFATGVQIYECKAADDKGPQWTLRGPEAELVDASGARLGRHYAGPTWEGTDGSTVVADVASRADSPQPGAIPWLLLRARAHSGDGIFGGALQVQRIDTVGGQPPAGGCASGDTGHEARVPYKATYYFYGPRA